MTEEVSFQIRIRAAEGGASRNLTIAELGILLTGINRAINKAAEGDSIIGYSPLSQEPVRIQSEITRIENGSVLLTVVTAIVDFTQQNLMQAGFLAGIFGNAAYDFTKVLGREIGRALSRIGNDVKQEDARVEPSFHGSQSLDPSRNDVVPPALQGSEPPRVSKASKPPLPHAKTIYSFSFEQKGIPRIAMSFSATNRI